MDRLANGARNVAPLGFQASASEGNRLSVESSGVQSEGVVGGRRSGGGYKNGEVVAGIRERVNTVDRGVDHCSALENVCLACN